MATETRPWQSQSAQGGLHDHGPPNNVTKNSTFKGVAIPKPLTLSPSPILVEPRRTSKDDSVLSSPVTPKRPNLQRGLSLQLPKQDVTSPSASKLTNSLMNRPPVSPKPESTTVPVPLGSPGSVLPRRSRGLDFSRACTNLHHSTLAEHSSPDSSPVIGGKAINVPRKSAFGPDSPMFGGSLWSNNTSQERSSLSCSVGSVNMMDYGTDSSDSDEDMFKGGEEEDTIHMTPQPFRSAFPHLGNRAVPSPGADPMNAFSPTAASLMSFKRRLRTKTGTRNLRKGSSSTSLQSSLPSPGPLSPPLGRLDHGGSGGYFGRDIDRKSIESRRESLSLGTHDLHISDSIDGDVPSNTPYDALGLSNPQVIRRAVTRRSNMLPKPKTFARIRAALQEEVCPVDTECRREAEVIRQVRESDPSPDSTVIVSQGPTAASSPAHTDVMDELSDIVARKSSSERRLSTTSSQHGSKSINGLPDFWNNRDERMKSTPPPFPFRANSTVSDDLMLETATSTAAPAAPLFPSGTYTSSPSRSSTPQPGPTAGELTRKTLGKRRRDDDFDQAMFKRRAVSPGMSLQNSPIMPPSPAQRDGGWWQTKAHRESSASSNGTSNATIGKRVGMQGMNDTNDGLMSMSIE